VEENGTHLLLSVVGDEGSHLRASAQSVGSSDSSRNSDSRRRPARGVGRGWQQWGTGRAA
jgi:hypothetical protein